MNGDLISRSALKQEIFNMCNCFDGVQQLVDKAPAVYAVQVVRCKDCIHLTRSPWNRPDMGWCKLCGHNRKMDYYCASGERVVNGDG